MLHKEIPFLRIGLPFWSGIILGSFYEPDLLFFIVSGFAVLILMIISIWSKALSNNYLYGIALSSALFVSGLYLYTIEKTRISILEPSETLFAGYVDDFPEEKVNTRSFIFRIEKSFEGDQETNVSGGILIYHRKDSSGVSFLPGDRLILKCQPLEVKNRGNPYEFNYQRYMLCQGVRYYAFTDSSDIAGLSRPRYLKLKHLALQTREKIIGMFRQRGINGDELALVSAMTVGQKNLLDNDQKEVFIKAGVMHIMAVSGLHAVILSLFIFKVLFFLKRRFNFIRILLALLLLWIFTFISGLTPSVLRATLMFTFLQAGKSMKRPVDGINSVLASAFVLALIKPSVIFEAGFLLSYCAVIYIVGFYRNFYLLVRPKGFLSDLIWQSAAVTIVAQTGTLPLTIMMFNRFPTLFLLTNIVIVPLSSLVIIVGLLVVLTFQLPHISGLLATVLSRLTWLTEFLTEKASSIPLSTIENIGMTPLKCMILTLLILFFFLTIFRKGKVSALIPLFFLLAYISVGTLQETGLRKSNELIVYNTQNIYSVGIRNGKKLHIISDTLGAGKEALKHSAALNLKIGKHPAESGVISITAGKTVIRICRTLNDAVAGKGPVDIAIVTGPIKKLNKIQQPLTIPVILIFGSNVRADQRLNESVRFISPDSVHFIRNYGAFRQPL